MMESSPAGVIGARNLEYFTLEDDEDEDTEIEEFVAENSNTKRKEVWFDLIEHSISLNSKFELLIQSLCSVISLSLQIKLLYYYATTDQNVYELTWTIVSLIGAGILNLIFAYWWTISKDKEHGEEQDGNTKRVFGQVGTSRVIYWCKLVCKGLSIILMVQPLYNLIAYWKNSSRRKRELKRPLILRTQPEPTKHEIYNVQNSLKFQLSQSTLAIIEVALRFLALGLVQCLLIGTSEENDEADTFIRTFTIAWNLILLSWEANQYSALHFYYTKSLQFQDVKMYGGGVISLTNSFSTTRLTFSFIMNLVSSGFRLYMITLLSTFLGFWISVFLLVIYVLLDFYVQKLPNQTRPRFENPVGNNGGLSSRPLDLISRAINLFVSHNLKLSAFLNFTYIFTLCYFMPRGFWYLAHWNSTDNSTIAQIYNHNDTNETAGRYEFAQQCNQNVTTLLQVPILHSISEFAFELFTLISWNCSNWRNNLFIDDFSLLVLFALQYSISLIVCAKINKKASQSESEFPNQIAYKFWNIWIDRKLKQWKTMGGIPKILNLEITKFLIALQLTDFELKQLSWNDRNYCFCCTKIRGKPERETIVNGIKISISEYEKHFNIHLQTAKSQILCPTFERLVQLYERRLTLRNTTNFDSSYNKLIEFWIRNLNEVGLNNSNGLTLLIYSIENIDSLVTTKVSSYKLNKLDKILV